MIRCFSNTTTGAQISGAVAHVSNTSTTFALQSNSTASYAVQVSNNALIDNLSVGTITSTGLCKFPATPSSSVICTTGSSGVCPMTQGCTPIGFDVSLLASGQLKIITAGRYFVTWDVLGFTNGTTSNYLNAVIYRGGGFNSYIFGSVINYAGTFTAFLDLLAGDGLVVNITGSVTVQRCALSARFVS